MALAGCNAQPVGTPFVGEAQVDANVLSWPAQEGAESYSVRVLYDARNGYEVPVRGTTYPLSLYHEGTYTISVRAKTADGYTAYSAPVTYVVDKDVPVTPTEDESIVLRGDGTKDSPLEIYTGKELATIKSGKARNEDGTERQLYYRLMADIDLAGAEWTSIGTHSESFEGIFDGNGHTVSNWVQTKSYDTNDYQVDGLFGHATNAIIVNLTVRDFAIDPGQINYTVSIGGLVGSGTNVVVENCHAVGSITVNRTLESSSKVRIGMIIGHASQNSTQHTRIERCTAYGTIDARYALVYAGGIVGVSSSSRNDFLNCYADVDVTAFGTAANTSANGAFAYAGQLAGYLSDVGEFDGCVGVGHAQAGARDGTRVENVGQGVIGATFRSSSTGAGGIRFTNVYFDYEALGLSLGEDFPDEASLAEYYALGGNIHQQYRYTTVYARTRAELGDPALVEGLDMDVWQIVDGELSLGPYHSEFYTVTYQVGDEIIGTQVVLKGQPATCPFSYEGTEYVFLRWDYDDAGIQADTTIYAIIRQGE